MQIVRPFVINLPMILSRTTQKESFSFSYNGGRHVHAHDVFRHDAHN